MCVKYLGWKFNTTLYLYNIHEICHDQIQKKRFLFLPIARFMAESPLTKDR